MASKKTRAAQFLQTNVDIKCFRDQAQEFLDKWREKQRKRFRDPGVIDQIVGKDIKSWAALKGRADLAKEQGSLMVKLKVRLTKRNVD